MYIKGMYPYIILAILIGIVLFVYKTIRAEGFKNQSEEPIAKSSIQKVIEYFNRFIEQHENTNHSTIRQYINNLKVHMKRLVDIVNSTPGDSSTIITSITTQDLYEMHVIADMITKI
jgi:hypothetical protein